jgi:hypothetical protein
MRGYFFRKTTEGLNRDSAFQVLKDNKISQFLKEKTLSSDPLAE